MELLSMPPPSVPSAGQDLTALASRARSGDPRAIDAVAGSFESMFVSLVLKQMRQTLEPDTMFGQDQGDVLGGLFDLTMGQHLGQSGALGIAGMVKKYLTQRGRDENSPRPTSPGNAVPGLGQSRSSVPGRNA